MPEDNPTPIAGAGERSNPADRGGATARCEVTGRSVAVEEMVEFCGRRVSAEGKAILLDCLRRGQRLPQAGLVRPSNGRRLLAWMVDWSLLMMAATAVVVAATGPMLYRMVEQALRSGQVLSQQEMLEQLRRHPMPMAVAATVVAVGSYAYYVLMHHGWGQTVGKKVVGLKVVSESGARPGLGQVMWREALHAGLVVLYTVGGLGLLLAGWPVERVLFWTGLGEWADRLYVVVSGLVLWTDRQAQQAIHDRLARTRVVDLKRHD